MKKLLDRLIMRLPLVYRLAIFYKGDIKRKLKFLSFAKLAQRNGVTNFRIERVADLYTKDLYDFSGTTKEQKQWAYQHGFSSYKMADWYGITKENFHDYISDFDFYSPKNYIRQRDIMAWFEQKDYDGHWAEVILHADKDGEFVGLNIDYNLPAEIIEEDLWVKPGDFVHGFEAANDAIGTLVLRFENKEDLEEAIAHQSRWLKVETR